MKKIFIIIAIFAYHKACFQGSQALSLNLDRSNFVLKLSLDLTENSKSKALTIFSDIDAIGEKNSLGDKNNIAKLFNLVWRDTSSEKPLYLPSEIAEWEDLCGEEQNLHKYRKEYKFVLEKAAMVWDQWIPSHPKIVDCEDLFLSNFLPNFSGYERFHSLDVVIKVGGQLTDDSVVLGIFNKKDKSLRLAHIFINDFFDPEDRALFKIRSNGLLNFLSKRVSLLKAAIENNLKIPYDLFSFFKKGAVSIDEENFVESLKNNDEKLLDSDKKHYQEKINQAEIFCELPKITKVGALIKIIGILKSELNEFDSQCPTIASHDIFVIANESNNWIKEIVPIYKDSGSSVKIIRASLQSSVELMFDNLPSSSLDAHQEYSLSLSSKNSSVDSLDLDGDSYFAKRRRLYFSNPCARYYTDYLCDFPREKSFCKVTLVC